MTRLIALLGSGEFLPWSAEVDRHLLDRASGDGSVAILPTASAPEGEDVFDSWARMGIDHYTGLGVAARVVPLKTREDAARPEIVTGIEGASLVYFSGGNPAYLAATLRDTPFWAAVTAAVDAGVALAGCSAGACFLGDVAPDPAAFDRIEQAFEPRGLSYFPGLVFGAHWDALDSYYPGLQAVALRMVPDGCRMIGLDEETAMVSDADVWRVFGRGAVHVYALDGSARRYPAGQTFRL